MSLEPLARSTSGAPLVACLLTSLLLGACASPPPAPLPERPPAPSSELTFTAAIDYAVDDLLVQAQRLPAFNPPPPPTGLAALTKKDEAPAPRSVIAVDPAIDGNTGQQTAASKMLDTRLLQRASEKFTQFDVVPVTSSNIGKAQQERFGSICH